MKLVLASAVLAVLLCSTLIEATSEPICLYKELNEPIRRLDEFIHFKDTSGCLRKVSCNEKYETVIQECSRTLCPADKALEEKVFPDCCCL